MDKTTKVCSVCKQPKPATRDYFTRQLTNTDGLRGTCKECISKLGRIRRESKLEWQGVIV